MTLCSPGGSTRALVEAILKALGFGDCVLVLTPVVRLDAPVPHGLVL